MKTLLLAGTALIASLLPLSGFSAAQCPIDSPNFCACFVKQCESSPARILGLCSSGAMGSYFNGSAGRKNAACLSHRPAGETQAQCTQAIDRFISSCSN